MRTHFSTANEWPWEIEVASAFKIEKGIPAPPASRAAKYPFAEMEIGDSLLIPGIKSSAEISSSISYRKNRYRENYICRAVEGGVRVWRTA
jgi:hypothetical protein